nr:MAG TPA: hypothetical protein [Caudoviricetes sp.]
MLTPPNRQNPLQPPENLCTLWPSFMVPKNKQGTHDAADHRRHSMVSNSV